MTKDVKIVIELENVTIEDTGLLEERINDGLSELYQEYINGDGGIAPYAEKWDISITAKSKSQGEVCMAKQGTLI